MKLRILELLNQATTDALYETKDAVDFLDNPVSKQQRELQLEKFAELLVRECLSQLYELTPPIISNENHQKLVDATYMMAVDIGVAKIKKHFGVEE
jgi:hypothetical protein